MIPDSIRKAINRSIDIIVTHGDSFVLPPSYEIGLIRDRREEVAELVTAIYAAFPDFPDTLPIRYDIVSTPVDDSGLRPITQLDPIWNIYLLALVIAAGPAIERARVPRACRVVHSFRFDHRDDSPALFDNNFGWLSFYDAGRERAARSNHVLSTDILTFSQTICHHHLGCALRDACPDSDLVDRIMSVLNALAEGRGFGLPVGAPSFSLLAELSLDSMDRMLSDNGIDYIRYIDDIRIFAESTDEAQSALSRLAQWLTSNTGFSLQKTKTYSLVSEAFLNRLPAAGDVAAATNRGGSQEFMRLRVHVDRCFELDRLCADANQRTIRSFDVVGLLGAELDKPRLNPNLVKRVVRSMIYLDHGHQAALVTLLARNLERLSSIFQSVLQAYLDLHDSFDSETRSNFCSAVKALWVGRSPILQVTANQSWVIRVLALAFDDLSEKILEELYHSTESAIVRRDVIIAMSNSSRHGFIEKVRERFSELTDSERRALIAAMHMLGKPGPGWSNEIALSVFEGVVGAWALEKRSATGGPARLPL
ncbi:MAG: RNA-directed DNA polymerase [Xanthomonadales bacterium]|nr:RNA-directed DNA polymerase [Xanthomonadales bacterium]